MPFFLDGNPTQSEVSEAVNYLLSNFTQNVSADPATGQITGPTGEGVGYLYKYIDVKYSDSFDGTLNFSDSPTNRAYYGLRNDDSSTESTNPADYSWYKVTGGFGTTKLLYYLTTGGRQIQFAVATAVPNSGWIQDSGAAIDLDITTKTNAVANFVVIRVANNSAAPTDSECISAIGRTPISGDICTVNYNSGIASITYKYTTGWAVFQKYITGDLIVANSIVASNINVGQLSAISANLGTVTAGELTIGTSPAISGNTMSGAGSHLYSDGRFALGNSSTNMVFDGTSAYLNGFNVAANGSVTTTNFLTASKYALISFTVSRTAIVQYGASGGLTVQAAIASTGFDSCLVDCKFTLETSGGSIVDTGYAGGGARVALIDVGRYFQSTVSFANTKSLAAGTYTLYVNKNNLYTADSAGTLTSPTLTGYYIANIYSNYHVLYI
jgi:hypothetical protein